MRCHFCKRPLPLFSWGRPLRAFAPLCRGCGRASYGWPHKAIIILAALALVFLAFQFALWVQEVMPHTPPPLDT